MNVNVAFLRHGYGCHNALTPLLTNGVIEKQDHKAFLNMQADPELTQMGVDASEHNGCIMSKIIKNLHKTENSKLLKMDTINLVGCSPLIRCMESAYYMTRNWVNPPNKIFVFPFLREVNERSDDIYSAESRRIMQTTPSYAMKTINEQKAYLQKIGILDYFDFRFVEIKDGPSYRQEPGDIGRFLEWFVYTLYSSENKKINMFITTHAGVLKNFMKDEGFSNNSGFVVNARLSKNGNKINDVVSLNKYLPNDFFTNYKNPTYNTKEYFCPSGRCGQLCNIAPSNKPLIKLDLKCTTSDQDNLTYIKNKE